MASRRSWLSVARTTRRAEVAIALIGNALLLDGDASRRVRSLEMLGDFRRGSGDLGGAVVVFQRALALTRDEKVRGRLFRKVAECQIWLLKPEEAQEAVKAGL